MYNRARAVLRYRLHAPGDCDFLYPTQPVDQVRNGGPKLDLRGGGQSPDTR